MEVFSYEDGENHDVVCSAAEASRVTVPAVSRQVRFVHGAICSQAISGHGAGTLKEICISVSESSVIS